MRPAPESGAPVPQPMSRTRVRGPTSGTNPRARPRVRRGSRSLPGQPAEQLKEQRCDPIWHHTPCCRLPLAGNRNVPRCRVWGRTRSICRSSCETTGAVVVSSTRVVARCQDAVTWSVRTWQARKRAALCGPVFTNDRGRPAHVLLSIEDYRRLSFRPAAQSCRRIVHARLGRYRIRSAPHPYQVP